MRIIMGMKHVKRCPKRSGGRFPESSPGRTVAGGVERISCGLRSREIGGKLVKAGLEDWGEEGKCHVNAWNARKSALHACVLRAVTEGKEMSRKLRWAVRC